MLTRIKSFKNLKGIFSYLNKISQLKIVYLNKFLFSKLSITSDDYKIYSEKYKITDSKGNEKVFSIYNNVLIYEFDKKTNQGIIYDEYGTKIYEGGLLNGKKNGIGKEYYYNNKIKFDGEFKYNKKWTGKGYDLKGNIKYEINNGSGSIIEYYDYYLKEKIKFRGELLNGEINGLGKEYFNKTGKLSFEGEYKHGKKNGKGKEYYMEKKLKIKYDCEYLDGIKWQGIGFDINGKQNCVIKKGKIYDNNNDLLYEETLYGIIRQYKNNQLIFSGKYKNGEKYGNCKEYNSKGMLVFEGIYLDGRKNGKGKEYENGQLIYEGNYLNDLYNGEGIKYYNNGKILFEGEYAKGKMKKGKLYDKNNELVFEGEFLDGKRWNGKGKEDTPNDKFEGEYINGKKNGKAIEYYNDGKIKFEGDYCNDIKINGKLYDKYTNDIYEIKSGKGYVKIYSYFDTLLYEGEYSNDEYNGRGKKYLNGILEYEGEFLNGVKQGRGVEYHIWGSERKKRKFEGEFINGEWKKGKKYKYDKLIYEGEFSNKKRNGKGKEYNYQDGSLIFEGEFKNGIKWNGHGKEFNDKNELIYEGEFKEGEKWNGNSFKTSTSYEGEYLNGKYNGMGEETNSHYDNIYYTHFKGEYLDGKKWNGIEEVLERGKRDSYNYIYKNGEKIKEKK